MSQSMVFIMPRNPSIDLIKRDGFSEWRRVEVARPDGLIDIQFQDSNPITNKVEYVNIGEMIPREEIIEEYKNDEYYERDFRVSLSDHCFYNVSFNSLRIFNEFSLRFLSGLPNVKSCWIDNGDGTILNATDVFKNLIKDPNWNWNRK